MVFLNNTSPASTTSSPVKLRNEIFFRLGVPAPPCPALPLHCTRLQNLFVRTRLTTPCLALYRSSFGRYLHPQEHQSTSWRRFLPSFCWFCRLLLKMLPKKTRAIALWVACVVGVTGGRSVRGRFRTFCIFFLYRQWLVRCVCYVCVGWG